MGASPTQPDKELLGRFRANARPGSVAQAGLKVSYAPTKDEGVEIAHRLWANAGLPGELSQVLPTPAHFEQASTLVSRDMTAESAVAGPDPERHVAAFEPFLVAGFDEIFVANMGPHYEDMIRAYAEKVLPELRSR